MKNRLLVLVALCALVISTFAVSAQAASYESCSPDKYYSVTIGDKTYSDTDSAKGNVDTIKVGDAGTVTIKYTEVKENANGDKVYEFVLDADANPNYAFEYWLVNGKKVYGSSLSVIPTEDINVVAVFKNTSTGELIYSDGTKDDNNVVSPKTGYSLVSLAVLFLASASVAVVARKKLHE